MSNPVDNLIDCIADMQTCVKCDSPLTQQHLDDARCPTCFASIEFGQQLRESTLDAAAQHQRLDAAEDVFNAVSVMQGDITREQHDQLREEAQDLDYSDDGQCSSEENDDAEVDSTVGSSTGRSLAAAAGKRRVSCAGKGKAVQDLSSCKRKGKFAARIMTRKKPPKETDGKVRTQVCGQAAERCAMDEKRLHKIHALMAKHNNFAEPEDLDDPAAMVDHFECLMILDEASTRNSHGKGSRYPRFLRDYVGHGKCYLYHSEITRSSQPRAHAFIDNFVRTVKIHTQNVNVKGSKVPAMQAPVKAREAKIRHLVNSHKHGIDDYLNLLDKLREGTIELPDPPSADAGTSLARSIVASGGRPRGRSWEAAVSNPPQSPKRMRFLGDPNSPSAVGMATIPGLDSDDDADDADDAQ